MFVHWLQRSCSAYAASSSNTDAWYLHKRQRVYIGLARIFVECPAPQQFFKNQLIGRGCVKLLCAYAKLRRMRELYKGKK